MSTTFVQVAGGVGRKILTISTLGILGIAVGISCALLPPAIPFGMVGIAAMALLLVMPDLRSVPEHWARRMTPIFMFVFTCVPVYYAIILPGLPWISIRRATLLLWVVPSVLVVAGSASARRRIINVLRASPILSTCTLGFMAITVATLPTAYSISQSIAYVGNSYLLYFIPMFLIISLRATEQSIHAIIKAIILGAFVNFIVGVVEAYLQRPFLIFILPSYMREQIFQSNAILESNLLQGMGMRNGSYRGSSTFTTALSWGEISAMTIPLCAHLLAHGRSSAERVLGAAGALICFLSIVLSGSRGAYVAMLTAVVSYSIFWSLRYTLLNKSSLTGKIALTLYSVASAATLLAVLFVGRIHRIVLGGGAEQLSTNSRYVEWALAQPKIMARPLLGYGGGSAGEVIHYVSMIGAYTVDGYYMNLLVDYGVPGFLLFFALFLIAAATGFRHYLMAVKPLSTLGNCLGASILAFTVYRTTLSQNDSLTFAFVLIALTLIYSLHMRHDPVPRQRVRI